MLNAVLEKPGAPRGKADFLFILLYCYRREGNCTALGGSIFYEIHDGKIE